MTQKFLSKLTGSFSIPAADNPTVAMVEAAYRHHGLDFRYINCEVPPEALADAVAGARAMGWVGFNCSLPHKVAVVRHLKGLGRSAEVIGAVNCAVRHGNDFIGENTDGLGFLDSLRQVIDPGGKSIVIFGAGGAARAIAVELALAGASHVIIVNRGHDRGQDLAKLLASRTKARSRYSPWQDRHIIPGDTDVVVNATSIGLSPDNDARLNIDEDSLRSTMVVADVIPNPPNTQLLQSAARQGCRTLDGLGMIVNQAVVAVRHWTGVEVDGRVMRAELDRIFGVGKGDP